MVLDLTQFEQAIDQFTALDVAQIESLKTIMPRRAIPCSAGEKWRTDALMQRILCQGLTCFLTALKETGFDALFAPHFEKKP